MKQRASWVRFCSSSSQSNAQGHSTALHQALGAPLPFSQLLCVPSHLMTNGSAVTPASCLLLPSGNAQHWGACTELCFVLLCMQRVPPQLLQSTLGQRDGTNTPSSCLQAMVIELSSPREAPFTHISIGGGWGFGARSTMLLAESRHGSAWLNSNVPMLLLALPAARSHSGLM